MPPFRSSEPETQISLFFFSSRRRHTRSDRDWSSDVCSSDLLPARRVVIVDSQRPSRHPLTSRGIDDRPPIGDRHTIDRKSTRLNSSHDQISYAVFCLKKKKKKKKKQKI